MALQSLIIGAEGGYVNNSNDKGGPTKFGISSVYCADALKRLGVVDVKNLTRNQALEIYYEDFWLPSKAPKIPDLKLAYTYFDVCVNSGIGRANMLLNNLPGNIFNFEADGKNKDYWQQQFQNYQSQRRLWYKSICIHDPSQSVFFKGWMNRLINLEKHVKELPMFQN